MTFSPSEPIKEQNALMQSSSDAFDRVIAQGVKNDLDIASQYKFSPERLRLFLNENRQFVQYENVSKFLDDDDRWVLQPAGGDKMRLQSAEPCTYIVGTEMRASMAFRLSQSLNNGDVVRVGPRTESNGWFLEQRGSDHTDTQADIKQLRNGVETTLEADVELGAPLTKKTTVTCYYNWYNVGEQRWVQTFSNGNEQTNEDIATTSTETGTSGPARANLRAYQEVEASSSTSGLEFEAGSMSMLTQAQTESLLRSKPVEKTVTLPTANDVWHPIYAMRIRPEDSAVNTRLANLQVINYSKDAALQLTAISFDPSKTDASNFGVPELHSAQNSCLQDTENVSEVPNESGTQINPSTTGFEFGGHILSYVSLNPVGDDYSSGAIKKSGEVKRNILPGDVVVVMAKSSIGGGDAKFNLVTEQDW